MEPDRIDLKGGKVTHKVLQDAWRIAYHVTGTASKRPGALSIEQMLWLVATATQAVAHVLVDVRENLDTLLKQNEQSEAHREQLFDQLHTSLGDFREALSAPPISQN